MTPDHVVALDYTPDFTDISLLDISFDAQLAKAIEVTSSSIVPGENEVSSENPSDEG